MIQFHFLYFCRSKKISRNGARRFDYYMTIRILNIVFRSNEFVVSFNYIIKIVMFILFWQVLEEIEKQNEVVEDIRSIISLKLVLTVPPVPPGSGKRKRSGNKVGQELMLLFFMPFQCGIYLWMKASMFKVGNTIKHSFDTENFSIRSLLKELYIKELHDLNTYFVYGRQITIRIRNDTSFWFFHRVSTTI